MRDLLDDWNAWSDREQVAVAAVALGLAMVVLGWLGA
jgi:hypothetical protein